MLLVRQIALLCGLCAVVLSTNEGSAAARSKSRRAHQQRTIRVAVQTSFAGSGRISKSVHRTVINALRGDPLVTTIGARRVRIVERQIQRGLSKKERRRRLLKELEADVWIEGRAYQTAFRWVAQVKLWQGKDAGLVGSARWLSRHRRGLLAIIRQRFWSRLGAGYP